MSTIIRGLAVGAITVLSTPIYAAALAKTCLYCSDPAFEAFAAAQGPGTHLLIDPPTWQIRRYLVEVRSGGSTNAVSPPADDNSTSRRKSTPLSVAPSATFTTDVTELAVPVAHQTAFMHYAEAYQQTGGQRLVVEAQVPAGSPISGNTAYDVSSNYSRRGDVQAWVFQHYGQGSGNPSTAAINSWMGQGDLITDNDNLNELLIELVFSDGSTATFRIEGNDNSHAEYVEGESVDADGTAIGDAPSDYRYGVREFSSLANLERFVEHLRRLGVEINTSGTTGGSLLSCISHSGHTVCRLNQ